jgi:hypothetical protein
MPVALHILSGDTMEEVLDLAPDSPVGRIQPRPHPSAFLPSHYPIDDQNGRGDRKRLNSEIGRPRLNPRCVGHAPEDEEEDGSHSKTDGGPVDCAKGPHSRDRTSRVVHGHNARKTSPVPGSGGSLDGTGRSAHHGSVRVADERGESKWLAALFAVAAVATILTFLFQFDIISWPPGGNGPSPSPSNGRPCDDASISLSRGSGPSGTEVVVSGGGFPSDEAVRLRFHTEELLPSRTDAGGAFEVEVVIPGTFDPFAPQQFTLSAVTSPTVCAGSAPFELTT